MSGDRGGPPGRGARAAAIALDLRLAVPAIVVWGTAFAAVGLPDARLAAVVTTGLGAAIAITALVVSRAAAQGPGAGADAVPRRRRAITVLAVASASAGLAGACALGVAAQDTTRRTAVLDDAARGRHAVALELRTTTDAVNGRVGGAVERVSAGGLSASASSPVLVFADALPRIRVGSLVRVSGTLSAAEPGDDVAYLVRARGDPVVIGRPAPLPDALGGLRDGFARAASALPSPGGGLLPGLALGDTSAVPSTLVDQLRVSSLTHLTAVSGANCAVVVGLVVALLAVLGASRRVRVLGAIAALGVFVVLVLPQPSVLRASVMALAVLASTALGRPVRGVPVLSAAVVALLLVDPWLARSYGFALSVLATGGLLLLAPLLIRRLAVVLPRPLALALAIPTAAQLACQPVLLLLTPTLPLWGVPANLLAEPAAPIATVLGLIACLILPLAPPLGHAVIALAWVPSAWIAAVARVCAGLPGAALPWPPGGAGIALAVLLGVAAVLALAPVARRVRLAAAALVVTAAVAGAGVVAGSAVATLRDRPGDWQYAECDIGQGDATLIRSAGVTALVDTGPDPTKMTRCLDDLGIGRISLLVLTHYDLDHVGGTDAVLGRVDRALIGPSSGADDDRVAARLRASGAAVEQGVEGMTGQLGDLRWRVLWPPSRGVEPGNPASVTLSVTPAPSCTTGCLTGLLLGDLGAESQTRLLGAEQLAHYDVVKVAHHGSADQAPALYQRIRATVGLIGVGIDNDYGHPTAFCLGMLAEAGTRPFRTDLEGTVLVEDDHGTPRVWTARAPPDSSLSAG